MAARVYVCVSVCGRDWFDAERLTVNNKCSRSKLRRLAVIFYPNIFQSLGPTDLICQSHHSENPPSHSPTATHALKIGGYTLAEHLQLSIHQTLMPF